MTVRAYIAVEGPHDVAFVAELLRPLGLSRVKVKDALDPYWERLVPKSFPHNNDLLARVPVPLFLQGADRSVAVHGVSGVNELVRRTEESLAVVNGERPAVAAILDADSKESAADRFAALAKDLRKLGLSIPDQPGVISAEIPRCGVFVLPDNASPGTLEVLLEECARERYPQLAELATSYIDRVDVTKLTGDDLKDFRKPAGRQKAIVSSIASVLRPAKALQVSLQDNEWLRGPALDLPRVTAVRHFLADLLALPG
ncbi:MAG TPA: DUF3226 domain-containing protein [Kofleriaceae bacterium]|nr:DUF3226 domain-containing protein [Kofleriaceae bacterium]